MVAANCMEPAAPSTLAPDTFNRDSSFRKVRIPMPIEAVIFDMDGVLVDSEVYWHLSRVEYARARGKVWTDADQRIAMGRSTVGWAQVMKDRLALAESTEDIIVEMKQRVMAHYDERLPLRDGAIDAVRMSAGNFKCALASGSPTDIIQHVMRLSGLDQVFEAIVYGDNYPNGKPAPDIYLAALDRLGVRAENAIGVEDSSNGIRSLKAAGMRAVAAPSAGFPLPPDIVALCDAHIDSLTEFTLELIRSLDNR
jgi:mannitol-1-/sugar-/sorbitol-6-/2-deoxyglucose-6-phosphatase